MGRGRNITIGIITILVVALAVFFYIRFYFVFGTGVKTGELNYVVHKGYVFKTYEGKIIQSGFQTNGGGGIHSNEFIFSVSDEDLAKKLMHDYDGKEVSLRYREYLGALPWRGYSKYIVDKIVPMDDSGDKKNSTHPFDQIPAAAMTGMDQNGSKK